MWAEGLRAHRWWIAASLLGLAVLLVLPGVMAPFYIRVGGLFLFSADLALSWALLGGLAGYWSFGHTAFIGLGAFSAALAEAQLHLPPGLSLAAGVLVGGLCSGLLALVLAWPILRLRGVYFAVAMLGVAQVLAELNNNVGLFKGTMGVVLRRIAIPGVTQEKFYYYVFLAAFAVTLLIAFLVKISRLGYGLVSLREDEDTARMLAVPTERYKAGVFVLSAILTGVLGVIYAHSLGYVTTDSVYRTDFSLNMIVHNLLGGMGTLAGPVVGALVMVVLTQVVLGSLLNIHMFITGALLVVLVLGAPRGLIGLFRRRPAAPSAAQLEPAE